MRETTMLVALMVWWCAAAIALAQEDPALVAMARKEGWLVFYSSMNAGDIQRLFDGFQKKYSFIKLNSFRLGDDALINKIRTEARAGSYLWDVVNTTTFGGYLLVKEGHFAK